MKKVLFSFALLFGLSGSVWAYDFSAVSPSGQTLYYNIVNGNVQVTCPNSTLYSGSYSGYSKPTGNLVIPGSVTYNGITYLVSSIGSCAFYGCSGLTSVTIPNSVTNIGWHAFYGCSSLTTPNTYW